MRRYLWFFALFAILFASLGCEGDEVIRFGAVIPLSGPYEIYGQSIRKGIDIALNDIQARQDFPYEIAVEILDSEGSPEVAQGQLKTLFAEGAFAVIGGVTTAEALAMVAEADRTQRVLISPSASSPELTGISKNFYRVFPSDSREGTMMGNFAARKLGISNVVIITKEDPFAKGIQEVFKGEFERNGGTVTEVIEYPQGAADFSGFVERVMTIGPDAVYLAAYADDTASLIKELRERNFAGEVLTTAAFALPEVIERVGPAAEKVFLTRAVFETSSEDPQIAAFVTHFREAYGLTPDLYAAHGYDALMILAQGLIESGSIASDFWKGVRGIRDYSGVTGTIQFDEKGDAQKFPRVYVISDGELIDYEREVEERRKTLIKKLQDLEQRQRGDG